MEAFPFVSEIVSVLTELWSMPEERRVEAPGFDAAMEMWGTINEAMQSQAMEPGFLEEFQKSPERMGYDLESRLKYMLWGNVDLTELLQRQLDNYKASSVASGTATSAIAFSMSSRSGDGQPEIAPVRPMAPFSSAGMFKVSAAFFASA